ncbi:MAG: ABC transporter permease [Gammaproteobacteria bacterium]|nr:ABC transporter permease [Gammaproteobacteria bacterium]
MTWLRLAFANLGLSPLTSAVNVVLMGLGTASIVLLLLAGAQLSETLSRDARGVDLVLGAKGSPVQLVLAAVYHADVPPGNIQRREAERWVSDPRVAAAVPLSLGDSYRGFRIVGTNEAYAGLYGASLAAGSFWSDPMEAVAGSAAARSAGLGVGARFAGAHGLVDGGHSHESRPYRVVGVLGPTGTVIDRLILTSLESVWALHNQDEPQPDDRHPEPEDVHFEDHDSAAEREHDHEEDDEPHGHPAQGHSDADGEITAMLIRYQSPLAATTLPREVNAGGTLQAASPAMEISRILQLVGIGLDGLTAFSWVLILTAALSVFAALYGSLRARRGDLAMLRCLGATRWELLWAMLLEGLLLSMFGVALGFLAGHGAMELLGGWLESTRGVALTGWTWIPSETVLLFGLFGVGVLAAALPAVQAYRTDVARTLAEG